MFTYLNFLPNRLFHETESGDKHQDTMIMFLVYLNLKTMIMFLGYLNLKTMNMFLDYLKLKMMIMFLENQEMF